MKARDIMTAPAISVTRETGVRVGTLDPLGQGDWEALMLRNLDALVEGLGGG